MERRKRARRRLLDSREGLASARPEIALVDLCSVIRSKQAGPFRLTFDLIFKTEEVYRRAKETHALDRDIVASLYGVPREQITDVIYYDPGRAVKITMIRPRVAGDPGDGDVYGCQQHIPFLGLCVKWST